MTSIKNLMEKQSGVVAICKEATIVEAARLMNEKNIGALVVTEGDKDKVVGIFTERDCLKRVIAVEADPATTRVGEVMTSPVAVCRPDTSAEECKSVMTEKRIRHLPVVENGKLVGIVTIGDLISQEVIKFEKTIEYLNQYIYGAT